MGGAMSKLLLFSPRESECVRHCDGVVTGDT